MVDGVADDGQSGGNGFVGIERVFFIQKIGQGVIGFHGKIEERKLAFRIYYGGNPAGFQGKRISLIFSIMELTQGTWL